MAEYDATTQDDKCIFCEIAAGNLKAPGLFWQDDEFMACLAIDPNTKGFSCVIPKQHFGSDVLKMPDDVLQRFVIASKKVARILESYFDDVGRVGLMIEGTGIDHAHIKLVPLHGTEDLKNGNWKQILSDKEFWFDKYEGWICSGSGPIADPEELAQLATAIRKSLG
jgi:histidine triad (HIT) family protein